ncbi:ribosomal RNA processing protein 36 homolog [Liolophura sinensis]|uniref:ribosomal RNA processing protein 36 homolog n=1 Tax=Liolophura sinensis TaxID=3198878 RepID=UPI0031582DC4
MEKMEDLSENEILSKGYDNLDGRFLSNRKEKKKLKKLRREKKHEIKDGLSSPYEVKDTRGLSRKRKISKSEQLVNIDSDALDCDEGTKTDSESYDSKPADDTEIADISQRLNSPTEPPSESVVDEDRSDEESELIAVKAELSQMSFEELQQLQEKLGMKVFHQVMHGKASTSGKKPTREEKSVFRRESKSMPMEITSKKRVSRFRHVIPTKKRVIRDPRFDERSGAYDEKLFKKSYSFIEDVKERERQKLKKQLNKAKDAEAKAKIKSLLNRMGQQQQAEEAKAKKAEKEKEWNKREKELVAQGKKPFFLKKSDKRKLELAEKYRELKKSGKLEKYLSKKRKKNSQKERRKMLN